MGVRELNESKPSDEVSKGLLVDETIGFRTPIGWTVKDKPHTDYRSTGIETAGILHRLLYGT